jgi:hypothetical protein
VGPRCPLKFNGAAGADGASDATWGRVLVAVDVLCSELVGFYEAEVKGFLVPRIVSAALQPAILDQCVYKLTIQRPQEGYRHS